ncbi:MAG: ABC transporter permease [Planctomycetales bacterium]
MMLLRSCWALWKLSVSRLAWSKSTLMLLFPIAACALFVFGARYGELNDSPSDFDRFSWEFVRGLMTSFLAPLVTLVYATASLGWDREDRTLIYLLIRPIPRPMIVAVKFLAATPVILAVVLGSFYVYCLMSGPVGARAFSLYAPMIVKYRDERTDASTQLEDYLR